MSATDDDARRFLELAQRDLTALRGMGEADVFAAAIFGFLAQQAMEMEKALKAWLCLAEAAVPRIHDLEQLFLKLEDRGQSVPHPFRELEYLTEFAVQLRYEASDDVGGDLDRLPVVDQVTQLVEHVARLLGRISGPGA